MLSIVSNDFYCQKNLFREYDEENGHKGDQWLFESQ